MNWPRLILALTIALVGVTVFLIARIRDPRRVFLLDLGREVDDRDLRRARRVVWVDAVACAFGIEVALFSKGPHLALLGTLVPLIPIVWMLIEIVLLVRSLPKELVPERFVVPLGTRPPARAYVSAPLQIANLAVFALATLMFWIVRSELPATVPLHFDAAGMPNRWGSPDELWMMAGLMLFHTALLWMIVLTVTRERWALPKSEPERYALVQRRRRQLIVRLSESLIASINFSLAVLWLSTAVGSLPGHRAILQSGVALSLLLLLVAIAGSLLGFLRPLMRVQEQLRVLAGTGALGTRADGWRAGGLIYFAPEDPAVFVPKQRGIGQTLNFARPSAWLVLAILLVVPMGIAVASQAIGKH